MQGYVGKDSKRKDRFRGYVTRQGRRYFTGLHKTRLEAQIALDKLLPTLPPPGKVGTEKVNDEINKAYEKGFAIGYRQGYVVGIDTGFKQLHDPKQVSGPKATGTD